MAILMMLILPIHEHGTCFHLFVSSLISFSSVVQFSEYRSFTSLVRFIPRYFASFNNNLDLRSPLKVITEFCPVYFLPCWNPIDFPKTFVGETRSLVALPTCSQTQNCLAASPQNNQCENPGESRKQVKACVSECVCR